jgi:hypothetical protein
MVIWFLSPPSRFDFNWSATHMNRAFKLTSLPGTPFDALGAVAMDG